MSIEWRAVSGFKHYEVSSGGDVRSLDRMVPCHGGQRLAKGKGMKPQKIVSTGYMQIDLEGKKKSVHRLVAEAFLGAAPAGMQVNHKNGDRTDNRIENLEWCTASENVQHGFRVLHPDCRPYLGKFSVEHPTSKAVTSTCMTTGAVTEYESAMDAVREGFDSSCISRCCAGLNRYHKGRTWNFAAKAGVFVPMGVAA